MYGLSHWGPFQPEIDPPLPNPELLAQVGCYSGAPWRLVPLREGPNPSFNHTSMLWSSDLPGARIFWSDKGKEFVDLEKFGYAKLSTKHKSSFRIAKICINHSHFINQYSHSGWFLCQTTICGKISHDVSMIQLPQYNLHLSPACLTTTLAGKNIWDSH